MPQPAEVHKDDAAIVVRNGVGVGRCNGVGVGRNFSFSALQLMQRPTPVRYGVGRRCNAQRHIFLALCTTMRDRAAIACNLTCHSMPTISIVHGDLCGSWRGRAPPLGIDYGTFSRDFGRKILRPRKILKNFGPDHGKFKNPPRHSMPTLRTVLGDL